VSNWYQVDWSNTKLTHYLHHQTSDPANPAAAGADQLIIWTSTMVRTGMTVAELNKSYEVIKWRCLSEIEAGSCDGLTYQQVRLMWLPCVTH
jgi:hypothetical protein